MTVRIIAVFGALCLIVSAALGQGRNVRISQAGGSPEEVSIAINPANPDNIIAGANIRYYYWSFDGGKTWGQSQLPTITYGDPCVAFGPDGRGYYAHLTNGWDAITVRTSDDGGRTWSSGVKLRGPSSDSAKPGSFFRSSLQDKEWLVTDLSNSAHRGNVYATWTDFTKYGSTNPRDSSVIVFARSTDRGDSFEPFVRISDRGGDARDDDATVEGAVPAVGPEGEVYVAWSGSDGLYFDRSFDGGGTWGVDKVITATPGGWVIDIPGVNRCNGLPVTVCDISSSVHRGTIYVNWVDSRNGDHDVFIVKSTDRGDTWSPPIRVNDDAVGNGREQFFTWAAVDPVTGELAIVFYDRRAYAGDSTDVYLARSFDGGATFRNECISEAAFFPTANVFMGDYNGISAYNGRIRPIWTRLHDGLLSIHTHLLDSTITAREPVPAPGEGLLLDPYPNPVTMASNFESTLRVRLDAAGEMDLAVYDMMGRRVQLLARGWMQAGEHAVAFRGASLAPGMYVCQLSHIREAGWAGASALLTVMK